MKPFDSLLKEWTGSLPSSMERLGGSGNNQAYLVHSGKEKLVLKHYFKSVGSRHQRGLVETSYIKLLHQSNIDNIPKLLRHSSDYKYALYSYIPGQEVTRPTEFDVLQAAKFVSKLVGINKYFRFSAAESCLNNQNYIDILNMRLTKLNDIQESGAIFSDFRSFLRLLEHRVTQEVGLFTASKTRLQESSFYLYSPSDFGFHNALNCKNNLFFLDFEYAGLDDPAKLICDFFSQPRIPVELPLYFKLFVRQAFPETYHSELFQRVSKIFPLIRLKWCCILLNEFLVEDNQRREFAKGIVNSESERQSRLALQLNKAEQMLDSIDSLKEELRSVLFDL